MYFNIPLWVMFGTMVAIPAVLIAANPQTKPRSTFVNREGIQKETSMKYQPHVDALVQRWNIASKENKIIAVVAVFVLLILITWQVRHAYVVSNALDRVYQVQSSLK